MCNFFGRAYISGIDCNNNLLVTWKLEFAVASSPSPVGTPLGHILFGSYLDNFLFLFLAIYSLS